MAASNHIRNVAIVGASGNSGKPMTESLLNTGKHTVAALTRVGSESKLPGGVIPKSIDYDKPETLVEALKGQDALVITLSGMAAKDAESKLIQAAGEAGVPWILTNEWGPDTMDEALVRDVVAYQSKVASRKFIEDLGQSSYISVMTGRWYEHALAMPASFGFDFTNRAALLFDEGDTRITTSTLPQVGRAVAALLSLPIKAEGSNGACLEHFKNGPVYVSSFTVSQKEMLESALRVTGTKANDWTITKKSSQERFANGLAAISRGDYAGYKKLSTRLFFPDGCGNFEHSKGTSNSLLGLPNEDIDEATKMAIECAKTSGQ